MLLRTQLLGCEGERSGLNHWTGVTQGTACSRADTSGSGRQSCEPELNFTGRTPEHKKPAHQPSASVLFFFYYLIESLSEPYELLYDEPLESQPTMRKYFPLSLTRRILRPQYVEYPHRPLYYE